MLEEISRVAVEISSHVRRTPVFNDTDLGLSPDWDLHFKMEGFQKCGSHKLRGAMAFVMAHPDTDGYVTASSGNHGQALAAASAKLGKECVVVMPADSNPLKMSATRRFGAEIVSEGIDGYNREPMADQIAQERSWIRNIAASREGMLGYSSIGMEIIDDVPDVAAVVVPIGFGALAAGICLAFKHRRPEARIIGAFPATATHVSESIRAGRIVSQNIVPDTVADGARSLRLADLAFPELRDHLYEAVPVDDSEILSAMWDLWTTLKVTVEPTSAMAFAATRKLTSVPDGPVVVVLTGANADLVDIGRRFEQLNIHERET